MTVSAGTMLWVATITSPAPVVDTDTGERLSLIIVDRDSGAQSAECKVDDSWDKISAGQDVGGWARRGLVPVPAGFGVPGAVLVKKADNPGSQNERDYIKLITLSTHDGQYSFPANSWVAPEHGTRVFFAGAAYLPKDTPTHLAELRATEIAKLRGPDNQQPRFANDRSFGYQWYNDLGKPAESGPLGRSKPALERPPLGGSAELPYPRHVGNTTTPSEGSANGTVGGVQWLPADEKFFFGKDQTFNGGTLKLLKPALFNGLKQAVKHDMDTYDSFNDMLGLFNDDQIAGEGKGWSLTVDDSFKAQLGLNNDAVEKVELGLLARFKDKLQKLVKGEPKFNKGSDVTDLFIFRKPRVLDNRDLPLVLSDEEWGRQCIAGMNPCTLVALTKLPGQQFPGCAIGPKHVDGEIAKLGGGTMQALVDAAAKGGKPRLFMMDYWALSAFWEEQQKKGKKEEEGRAEHCGRALLFLQQTADGKEQAMIPLAFELRNKLSAALEEAEGRTLPNGAGIVYSRQELLGAGTTEGKNLWLLAKCVFRALDFGYHQLISHWLRCHACIEPFIIATHRQISTMHPVYKLMLPHYRYTLQINSLGRSTLTTAGGIIESCFTPGEYCMRLSSAVYRDWRFSTQALPADLAARGMLDGEGKPWLSDYPYAQEGLEIWGGIEAYFKEYLQLYYKSDGDVAGDAELQAWWDESKNSGHPDVKLLEPNEAAAWGFAGNIDSIDKLVRVLTTIAFIASAHHTAVNFGQYDFASLLMNVSSFIRRHIPRPPHAAGTPAKVATPDQAKAVAADAAALKKLAATGDKAEKEILSYLSSPAVMLQVMVTVNLLSQHAGDEQTLNERNTLLVDPAAVAANTRFMAVMEAAEAKAQTRNNEPAHWTRNTAGGKGMPYTLLMPPTVQEGITMRGVPYSITI